MAVKRRARKRRPVSDGSLARAADTCLTLREGHAVSSRRASPHAGPSPPRNDLTILDRDGRLRRVALRNVGDGDIGSCTVSSRHPICSVNGTPGRGKLRLGPGTDPTDDVPHHASLRHTQETLKV